MSATPRLWATIDRIEQDEQGRQVAILVFDDGQQLMVPRESLPPGVDVNQVVEVSLHVDSEETARRIGEIERLQRGLFGD